MTGPAILALDPSLTSTGWCRAEPANRFDHHRETHRPRAGSTANTNDEADAYWLHRIASAAYQPIDALPKYQVEAATGIGWPTIGNHQPSTKPNIPTKRKKPTT
jgi:hypothetical protein